MKPFKGEVLSVKMSKTAVVGVRRTKIHPLYKKRTSSLSKCHVHDEVGVQIGDMVEFQSTKPISKTKKWTIVRIIKK
ncbi:MAG: 30S ribosomal protein S17 [bacterium]|nr:30S ribosomal protein S17 [bacterium]